MPEVLSGNHPRLTVADIKRAAADHVGVSIENARFSTAVGDWIRDTIREMQLRWPQLRRVCVFDAPFTLLEGESDYDVRDTEANGGFGWDNCYQVLRLKVPALSDLPLEALTPDQYRERGYLAEDSGPCSAWVEIDQYRIRVVPTPDQDYAGLGEYSQLIPIPEDGSQGVDWLHPWDVVLLEGVLFRAFRWNNPANPAEWVSQQRLWRERLDEMWKSEVSQVMSQQATVTRNLRSRNRLFRAKNDVYYRGRR